MSFLCHLQKDLVEKRHEHCLNKSAYCFYTNMKTVVLFHNILGTAISDLPKGVSVSMAAETASHWSTSEHLSFPMPLNKCSLPFPCSRGILKKGLHKRIAYFSDRLKPQYLSFSKSRTVPHGCTDATYKISQQPVLKPLQEPFTCSERQRETCMLTLLH